MDRRLQGNDGLLFRLREVDQCLYLSQDTWKVLGRSGNDEILASVVLVVRVSGKIQTPMMPRVVVAKNKLLLVGHILVSIHLNLQT
jgi:hypothetical protein